MKYLVCFIIIFVAPFIFIVSVPYTFINYLIFFSIYVLVLLGIFIFGGKKNNALLLKSFANQFPGEFSFMSTSYKGRYVDHKFTVSIVNAGYKGFYQWNLKLLMNTNINFDATIYLDKNPGPVLFKKRNRFEQRDNLYSYSSKPKHAKDFICNEENRRQIKEIMLISRKAYTLFIPFIIKRNQMSTKITTPSKQLDPVLVKNILEKMLALSKRL